MLEFAALLRGPGISRRLIVEWKVEVKIEAARNTLPYARPGSVLSSAETPVGRDVLWSGAPAKGSREAWARSVGIGVHRASLTVPHLWGIVVACAEDVYCLVAAVAEHLAVRVVGALADKAGIPHFDREQLIFHEHGWINLGFLHLILHGISVDDGAADCLAELDGVEYGATYGTAVRAFDPRLEAGIVQVVSARQKMGYDFVIIVDTRSGTKVSMEV